VEAEETAASGVDRPEPLPMLMVLQLLVWFVFAAPPRRSLLSTMAGTPPSSLPEWLYSDESARFLWRGHSGSERGPEANKVAW
jgi:hypothetical protein